MRPIFDEYKRKGSELEETIYNSFDSLTSVFDLQEPYNGKLDILDKAEERLSKDFYTVFKSLYYKRLKIIIKSIYILRKLNSLNNRVDREDYLKKYFSKRDIDFLLGVINPMIEFDLYSQQGLRDINPTALQHYQDWCIDYLISHLELYNGE